MTNKKDMNKSNNFFCYCKSNRIWLEWSRIWRKVK